MDIEKSDDRSEQTALPPGPWLVFARQPGEEMVALGGSLISARRDNIAVAIVYLQSAPVSSGDYLPEIRRVFHAGSLGNPDEMRSLVPLIAEIAPATVFLPSRLEEDPNLRKISITVENLLEAASFVGAAWYYELSRVGEVNRFVDISAVVEDKHAALKRLAGIQSFPPHEVVEHLRAGQIPGATAGEAFWAVDQFEPLRGVTSALSYLARRSQESRTTTFPRVSVVVRTKDRPRLVEEALASLAIQDYPDLDVIVVNDGGNSVERQVKRFENSLKIRVIDLAPSRGRSAAANVGIAAAQGDWLLMLDDDDLYLAEGIRTLASAATDSDGVYYGKVEAVRYDGESRRHLRYFGAEYDADLMLFENQIPFIGCLMPLAQVRAVGCVDEELACFEDWDLYLRLAERCKFRYVDRVVAEYRNFSESFITGKGGLELQEKGLSHIFAKHASCRDPARLARAQIAVKRYLIPREVRVAETVVHDRMTEEMRKLADRTVLASNDVLVSVIIVNYNGRHHLEKCLPSLFGTRKIGMEVIVVDNGSRDDSVAWMREHWPQVRIMAEQSNLGFGRANLVGVLAARSNYVALLNSDTVVTPDWLTHLIQPMLVDPGVGSTCSQLRLLSKPDLLNARGGGMSRLGFGYDISFGFPFVPAATWEDLTPVDVLFPSGAAMLMRKPEFLDIGAFDPSFFMYHEDVDLGWRFWLLGKRVVMCPGSIVFHAFGGTTQVEQGASWRDQMGNRHNLRSLWKNYELRNALAATKRLVWGWLRSGHFQFAFHVLAWNLIHIRGTWRERKRLQRLRKFSDAQLFERGLISDGVPPTPDLSVATPAVLSEPDIPTSHLWPGRSSALGRLGPGWYYPEIVDNALVRAMCGSARARLHLTPNIKGTLSVDVHVPIALRGKTEISITCNGDTQSFQQGGEAFWETVRMPSLADHDGNLQVEIRCPHWRSHEGFRKGDLREIGCFVRHLAFQGERVETAYTPESVSVLITTFKRWDILQRTLAALVKQTWKEFEVIVVDDGSRDGTWENLQRWLTEHPGEIRLKIFTQENTGQGIARNNGLAHAEGELILFMGDDTIPEPDFIEQHVQRHRDIGMPCAVVGYTDWDHTNMRVTPLLEYVNEGGHQFGYRYMKDGEDVPYTCFYTSNVSLPRDVLGSQPFDPKFRTYGWEDIDVGYRLSKRGLRIVYNRKARVRHLHPMNLKDFYSRQIKVGSAVGTIYAIHPDLMHDPLMPPSNRPHLWRVLLRLVVPPSLPLINWLDSRSIRLPERLYRIVLSAGFWIGRDFGASAGASKG